MSEQLAIQKVLSWSQHLVILKYLPELILRHYQFLPSTPDEKKKVCGLKFKHATLAQWLDYLVPGDKSLDPDLFFTNKIKFKARAEQSKAVLDLAVELLPRVGALQEYFATPADVWFAWEVDILNRAMLKSGLLTGVPALDVSKERVEGFNKELDKLTNELWKLKKLQETSESNPLTKSSESSNGSAAELVLSWTALIAAEDTSFSSSVAFRNFRRKSTAWFRYFRRDDDFQISLLENGKELPTGRNRPRTPKKVKGFM